MLKRLLQRRNSPATGVRGEAIDVAAQIDEAIDKKLVYVVFQPLVDLRRHTVFAYEALARSRSPHFSGPLPLFRAAVEAQAVGRLGRLLRKMAVQQCPDHPLFLNVHPNEFAEGWLVRPDDSTFWHQDDVYVEITESVPLSHFDYCHSVLKEIRAKGVQLAVDDLGAGYSNLKYIADLVPEVVKIDRELIAGMDRNNRQRRLFNWIVRLCDELGAKVVAEGIETEAELKAAIDAGADYGQGFLLARPNFPPPSVRWIW